MANPELPRWPLSFDDPTEAERAFDWLNENRRKRGLPLLDRGIIDDRTGRNPVASAFAERTASQVEEPQTDRSESRVIYEKGDVDRLVSDATPETPREGDQLAARVLKKDAIEFHAYHKNDAAGHGGLQEHARRGPGESYHLHLRHKDGTLGPRISTETWQPLTDEDAKKFTGKFKQAIESLSKEEKQYLYRANREVFHTGRVPSGLIMKFGLQGMKPPRGWDN